MDLVEFSEYLVKSIVKEPDMVRVKSFAGDEEATILEIIVAENDMGAVIGKGGKMASALRTLILAKAYIQGVHNVKINIDSF